VSQAERYDSVNDASGTDALPQRHDEDGLPSVTLVVSAHNEAPVIREKIENSLAIDYPSGKLEIMVISDGSSDATDSIVESYASRGVVLCRQDPRGGKSLGLTRFVPQAKGAIIVFSDANSIYRPDAIRNLVRHFADPAIGFVVGHQRYIEDESLSTASESLYWRYETFLKVQESRIGSVVCGDGAIYAIRAGLFEPLREDDINDFTLPLKIIARGHRGLFDREAVCYERGAGGFAGEFRRKVRIINRSFRAVCRLPQTLNPFRVGLFAYQLAVHKVLRWFIPFLLLLAFAANVMLAATGSLVYQILLCCQLSFYALASLGLVPGLRSLKPVYVASYFCIVNIAALLGVLGVMVGKRYVTWNPQRPDDGPAAPVGMTLECSE
jgi:cellulose synthase/poly-beta-1,6-N-acetylglucosamine synthase-like glycosyltransferase